MPLRSTRLLAVALATGLAAGTILVAPSIAVADDGQGVLTLPPLTRSGANFQRPTTAAGAQRPAAPLTGRSSALPQTDAAAGAIGILDTACPRGQVVANFYDAQGFESGLPYPEYSGGWTTGPPSDGTPAPVGTSVALSDSIAGTVTENYLNTTFQPIDTSASLYVSLLYRGEFLPDEVGIYINDAGGALPASETWRSLTLDATSERGTNNGMVDVYIDLATDIKVGASHVEVDDVRVYSCAAPPASGVRGDWTGEGVVDLLATTPAGSLWLYPGKGDGRVSGGIKVGSGWQDMNYKGSPGDVTGDRRTDLVARSSQGKMWLYPGLGAGAFAGARQIGSSWGSMTSLATPGDMDLDGRPELLARRSDGTLHVYSFALTGSLAYRAQVGSGWNGMAWIIGMGDLNGDRRGDTVGVNSTNGCLYSYSTTTTLSLGRATRVGCGWGTMTYLSSPGDLNGDRLGDLVARASDGSLWFYQGRPGGGVRGGVKVGTGWNGMSAIL